MHSSEIKSMCQEIAQSTDLPVDWVLEHVYRRAGRPCSRCDGSGYLNSQTCFRCSGVGGKASHASVTVALDWVKENIVYIKKQAAKKPLDEAERCILVEAWKQDHHEEWSLLEGMMENDFRQSMIRAIEEGRITIDQPSALQRMVREKKRREVWAPPAGSVATATGWITKALHTMDAQNNKVFRMEFEVEDGWRGRIDLISTETIDAIQARMLDDINLVGKVLWQKERYAILSPDTEIELLKPWFI